MLKELNEEMPAFLVDIHNDVLLLTPAHVKLHRFF
jgi:SepF-like predicted cell division protein (DUF552 family)